MSFTHLALDGTWETCADNTDCASPVHTELSVEETRLLPSHIILTLAEIMDPPTKINETGVKHWLDAQGRHHRDYDLPATNGADDSYSWYQHGLRYRADDKPGFISYLYGISIWYVNGHEGRADDKPSRVYFGGRQEWRNGKHLGRDNGPAILHPDGSGDWYDQGKFVMHTDPEGQVTR